MPKSKTDVKDNNSLKERIAKLQLYRTYNIGPISFHKLINRFGNATEALKKLPEITQRHGRKITPVSTQKINDELEMAGKLGAKLLVLGDKDFPYPFAHTDGLPPVIFAIGHTSLLNKFSIAIVGARNASQMSCHYAERIAEELGANDLTIVSGMARGIDAAAHRGSLKSGTIAILAGGVDYIYPHENTELYHNICNQGCVISEMPIGTKASARLFPIRNRIVAGISVATLVVEAEAKSGSLITARLATEMGRDVFAIPGNPRDSRARGCNKLIKEGAYLVETPADILNNISKFKSKDLFSETFDPQSAVPTIDDSDASKISKQVVEVLIKSSADINTLINETKISAGVLKAVLLEMELSDIITNSPSGLCSLKPRSAT